MSFESESPVSGMVRGIRTTSTNPKRIQGKSMWNSPERGAEPPCLAESCPCLPESCLNQAHLVFFHFQCGYTNRETSKASPGESWLIRASLALVATPCPLKGIPYTLVPTDDEHKLRDEERVLVMFTAIKQGLDERAHGTRSCITSPNSCHLQHELSAFRSFQSLVPFVQHPGQPPTCFVVQHIVSAGFAHELSTRSRFGRIQVVSCDGTFPQRLCFAAFRARVGISAAF